MLTDDTCVSALPRVPARAVCGAGRAGAWPALRRLRLPRYAAAGPASGANFPRSGARSGARRAAPDLQRVRLSRQVLEREPGPPVHDALGMSKHARDLSAPVRAPVVRSPLARPPGQLAPAAPQQGRPEL